VRVVDDDWLDELSPLVRAAATGDRANVAEQLAVGVDPNQAAQDGRSALHAAATFDHTEIVVLLLDAGAAVGARTDNGFTPL
jgi:ankyrin repeat protein